MKNKITYLRADGKIVSGQLPEEIAWVAARGAAKERHGNVTLYGKFGIAVFNPSGGGVVTWTEKSLTPGETDLFDDHTTVCI